MNIYVGNLPYSATDNDLREIFGQFGSVTSANIVIDKVTGQSRGFAFVEMAVAGEGARAIDQLNGTEWKGRTLTVNEARPREERPRNGGGGGGARYGGGGGGSRSGYAESGGGDRSRDHDRGSSDRGRDRGDYRDRGRSRGGEWGGRESRGRDDWDSGDDY